MNPTDRELARGTFALLMHEKARLESSSIPLHANWQQAHAQAVISYSARCAEFVQDHSDLIQSALDDHQGREEGRAVVVTDAMVEAAARVHCAAAGQTLDNLRGLVRQGIIDVSRAALTAALEAE